jgi:hypothetical protein
MNTLYKCISALSLLALVACSDDSSSSNINGPEPDSSEQEAVSSSSGQKTGPGSSDQKADPSSSDSTPKSSASPSGGSESSVETDPAKIFNVRVPNQESYVCESPVMGTSETIADHDVICTFKHGKLDGFIYMQGTPTSCSGFMQMFPVVENPKIQLYVNGTDAKVSEATYDWGGNHHVDEISFVYDGKMYAYNHSSMGFGWRPCQEMDCIKVYSADGELIEDGCGLDRTIPIVCNVVDKDGKFGTFEDYFEVCEGDERLTSDSQTDDE